MELGREIVTRIGGNAKVGRIREGTLNDWEDVDEYWSAEMAISIEEFTERGDNFGPNSEWTMLISRLIVYHYLPHRKLSMYPQLSRTDFHMYEKYAVLELRK